MALTPEQMEDQLLRLTDRVEVLARNRNTDPRIPLLANDFDVEDAIFASHALYVVKTTEETLTTSIVIQDDDELFFPVGGFEHWGFEFFIIWDSPTAADIKFTITVPSSATGEWVLSKQQTTNVTYIADKAFGSTTAVASDAADTNYGSHIFGAVLTAATGGNVTLQWAQNGSSGTTTVHDHSWLRASRID